MSDLVEAPAGKTQQPLREVVELLLTELRQGTGERDKRRQVEEWLRTLGEKYPDFPIAEGLRDYYIAEAARLRAEFETAKDLGEKLTLGRSIESFLDRASDAERRIAER